MFEQEEAEIIYLNATPKYRKIKTGCQKKKGFFINAGGTNILQHVRMINYI